MKRYVRCPGTPDDRDPHKLTINVTTEDIRLGRRCSNTACPIALAIKREVPDMVVSVGQGSIVLLNRAGEACAFIEMPPVASRFVEGFDGKENVKPFQFTVRY